MLWDPTRKPRLRPLEAFRLPQGDGAPVGLRDRSGLSDVALSLSQPALQILALMDGTHTCEDICREFRTAYGQPLSPDTLQTMVEQLEQAHLLEGSAFEEYFQARQAEYREAGVRPMRDAVGLGLAGDSGELFESMLEEVGTAGSGTVTGRVAGLVAPHLDYSRGRPCYAAAYATLRQREVPDCVVIFGTNHFGRSTSVVATACDFSTPLGTTRTDTELLGRLEVQCGNLRTHELDHLREHSIELQVAWLQYLFGADSFKIVPLLCPDPCIPPELGLSDRPRLDLMNLANALAGLIREDDRDVLLVAGADLSHIGAGFGDQQGLDDALLERARQRDTRALSKLEVNDPSAFLCAVADEDNATRVCSAGCIFALATALPNTTGSVLRYHQAVDRESQICVTCAAVAFT